MAPKRKARTQITKSTKKLKLDKDDEGVEVNREEEKVLTDEEIDLPESKSTPNLERKDTLEIEDENEIKPEKLLQKSRSQKRLSLTLFGKDEDILDTEELSTEAKTKLQRSLSSILQPKFSRNEIIVRTHKIVDEDVREFQRNIEQGSEINDIEDEEIHFDDIPVELIILIFE